MSQKSHTNNNVREPIAITGISLRFPGGTTDPASFWRFLKQGKNGIQEIPDHRWATSSFYDPVPGKPGKTYSKWGGLLEEVDAFDAAFFGISNSEAEVMDPQQRLLLEASWNALEDSGEILDRSAGADIGVFVGISTTDYMRQNDSLEDLNKASAYSATGGAMSIAANRISHAFNLSGPSFSVDTACSSSLVAVHNACESLYNRECELALAGGVNLILSPNTWIAFCAMSALSKDGQCKAFDSRADGFVRSEGVGVVVLQPLARALARGDRIYACIRGTLLNQDGHTPAISMPDQGAQERLIRHTCERAGIDPAEIDYVEAHGTGTAIGDPIEATAIGRVLGKAHSESKPLLVGSVKTNLGHLESASGIAGLIKAALVLWHREVPPNLHFRCGNPQIDFDGLHLRVPTETVPLDPGSRRRAHVNINSFGFGGTNAHVILEEAPQRSEIESGDCRPVDERTCYILPISADSRASLLALAQQYATLFADADKAQTQALCAAASQRRAFLTQRVAVSGTSANELAESLQAFSNGERNLGLTEGMVAGKSTSDKGLVFVFSGQGQQWFAMGRGLLDSSPLFREWMQRCHDGILSLGGFSLLDELRADEEQSRIPQTEIAQPAIFSVQVALLELLKAWGIKPEAVLGHSVGEVAAAYAAGALSFEDAVRVIYFRGHSMRNSAGGKMMAVGVSAEEAVEAIAKYGERLSLAALNAPQSVAISGDPGPVEEVFAHFESKGIFCRYVPVNYGFHSAHMEPLREEILRVLDPIRPQPPSLQMYSTVSGCREDGAIFGAEYWWRNVRQPVRFGPAIATIIDEGYSAFLEIASHPVLGPSLRQCSEEKGIKDGLVLGSLRRQENDGHMLGRMVGELFCKGWNINWNKINGRGSARISLPHYPWNHQKFWRESPYYSIHLHTPVSHPMLVRRQPGPDQSYNFSPDRKLFPYLNDHSVMGRLVFPGAAYVEAGLALAREKFGAGQKVLEEVEFQRAFFLPEGAPNTKLRISLDNELNAFSIHSCTDAESKVWTQHAVGLIRVSKKPKPDRQDWFRQVRQRCSEVLDTAELYRQLAEVGLQYGPLFQGLKQVYRGDQEAWARIELPAALRAEAGPYCLHPVLLDAAFQLVVATIRVDEANSLASAYMPVWIERLRFFEKPAETLQAHVRLRHWSVHKLEADLTLFDERGEVIAELQGFACQGLEDRSKRDPLGLDCALVQYEWILQHPPENALQSSPKTFFPPQQAIMTSVQQVFEQQMKDLQVRCRTGTLQEIERELVSYYIEHALGTLGWQPKVGSRYAWQDFVDLGIQQQHHPLVRRFLGVLCQTGMLRQASEDLWEVRHPPQQRKIVPIAQRWADELPGFIIELELSLLCGESLAEVLRGDKTAIEVLFGPDSAHLLQKFYEVSFSFRLPNLAIRETVAALAKTLPAGRRLNVLEIGAGTGGSTAGYLSELYEYPFKLTFTDISEAFFIQAEEKFQDLETIRYAKLDISKLPTAQDFEREYDLIIATDVLHATPVLRESLKHIRLLLRPGGYFVLTEVDHPHLFADLVFGLTEGWWQFQDTDLRPDYALLGREQWLQTLRESGFTDVAVVSEPDDESAWGHGTYIMREPLTTEETFPSSTVSAITGDPASDASQQKTAVLLGDRDGLAERLAEALDEEGQRRVSLIPLEEWSADVEVFVQGLAPGLQDRSIAEIVYFAAGEAKLTDKTPAGDLMEAQRWTTDLPLLLTQALLRVLPGQNTASLLFVTQGAQTLPGDQTIALAQAPTVGFARVLMQEVPELNVRLIDMPLSVSALEADSFCRELTIHGEDEEVCLRKEGRYVLRIRYTTPQAQKPVRRDWISRTPCRLTSRQFGVLEQLHLEREERREPGPKDVEVEIVAAGLNFRDVMKALKIYPAEAEDAQQLGDEFSGVVTRVGDAVSRWRPGDRVMGASPGCFRSHTIVDQDMLFPLPEEWNWEEGASFFVAGLTAFYALQLSGRLQPGERVLVHSAAGGVGFAAVQLAKALGAEVFATAGNPLKRALLRSMGIAHIFDSRSVEFAAEIMEATGGEGVDLVLNALAGEAIPKSLSCLRRGGRFLEIGKRDIYGNSQLGLRPFKNELTFVSIDLARMIGGYGLREMNLSLTELIEQKKVRPLPHCAFSLNKAVDAFRFMTQGKHIGKLLFNLNHERGKVGYPMLGQMPPVRPDRTMIVTGGVRGFGLAVARWLVEKGAKHLVLISRSGRGDDETSAALEWMSKQRVEVRIKAVDVADESAVTVLLDKVRQSGVPIGGIFHAAVVYADETVFKMTKEQFAAATHPKMLGGWNLHRLTLDDPLEYFVLFSSVSTLTANPTQSNYVAANVFLESLARYRRQQKRPGLAVSFARLLDTGYVARNKALGEYMGRIGWEGISNHQAFGALELLMANAAVHMGVSEKTFWNSSAIEGFRVRSRRFDDLVQVQEGDEEGASPLHIRQELFSLPESERQAKLADFLTDQIAQVLRVSASRISRTQPLNEQGLDSLMAVELLSLLESRLGVPIPASRLVDSPTIPKISALILENLTGQTSAGHPPGNIGEKAEVTSIAPGQIPVLRDDDSPQTDCQRLIDYLSTIEFAEPEVRPATVPERIFFTGATGFIGAYVLKELLRESPATVYPLVRATSELDALVRLRESFKRYGLDQGLLESGRVRPVCGDLRQQDLGMPEEDFRRLAENVDLVLHSGAEVNHIVSYAQLRNVNVVSTLNVIRLASACIRKPIHYLSSVAVFNPYTAQGRDTRYEADGPDELSSLKTGGYGISKAVSERLLVNAANKGISVSIYRLPPVVGDGEMGICGGDNITWVFLKMCLTMGVAPKSDWNLYLTPVDFISKNLVYNLTHGGKTKTLHLVSPHAISFNDLFDFARAQGYPLHLIAFSELKGMMKKLKQSEHFATYVVFLRDQVEEAFEHQNLPTLDSRDFQEILMETGYAVEPLTKRRLELYFDYFRGSGFFPPPPVEGMAVSRQEKIESDSN